MTAVLLSDEAIVLLNDGDLTAASKCFHMALTSLKNGLIAAADDDELTNRSSQVHCTVCEMCQEQDFGKAFSPNNAFDIYGTVFRIHSGLPHGAPAAVLCYNIGFVMHLQGLIKARHVFLVKALDLYRCASSLLRGFVLTSSETSLVHLQLAIWTNMGHIYDHFYEKVFVEEISKEILALLLTVEHAWTMVDKKHRQFFSANLFHFVMTGCTSTFAASMA